MLLIMQPERQSINVWKWRNTFYSYMA